MKSVSCDLTPKTVEDFAFTDCVSAGPVGEWVGATELEPVGTHSKKKVIRATGVEPVT